MPAPDLPALTAEIVACRACPRLVAWREDVAREKRAAYRDEEYWGRPVPGFGDPGARLLVVGLAPAAHGGNRTGRVFTGDRSGDFLFASMHRIGFANQAESVRLDDGLQLLDAYVAAAVRCAPPANKPTPEERDTCMPYLVREMQLLANLRVIVTLGAFGYEATWSTLRVGRARRGGATGAAAALHARTRGRVWNGHDRRRVPPEPAEHVHRQAHARHARRGVRARPSVDRRQLMRASNSPKP